MQKFVSYVRVSTQRQGESGLGIEAQQQSVASYLKRVGGELTGEFVEIESGRKTEKDRPQLRAALEACRKQKAVLVVAKLDRIARDVRFFLEVVDTSKVNIAFADLPDVNTSTAEGRMVLVSMANFAEFEARRIGERTKAALAAAKARGVVLGATWKDNLSPNIEQRQQQSQAFAQSLAGLFEGFKLRGLTQRQMVEELNKLQIKTARECSWSLKQVQRVLKSLDAQQSEALN